MLYLAQLAILSRKQVSLVYLEGEDLKTLQHAEFHGVKWDAEKAESLLASNKERILGIESSLQTYLPVLPGGVVFNYDSGDQLSALLYGGIIVYDIGKSEEATYKSGPRTGEVYTKTRWSMENVIFPQRFKPLEGTEVKKTKNNDNKGGVRFYQVDQPTLKQLTTRRKEDKELLANLDERSKIIKVAEMVASIQNKISTMAWQDGYIHGAFNQNAVRTGRLSSSGPNLQNTPVEVDELFITRYENNSSR